MTETDKYKYCMARWTYESTGEETHRCTRLAAWHLSGLPEALDLDPRGNLRADPAFAVDKTTMACGEQNVVACSSHLIIMIRAMLEQRALCLNHCVTIEECGPWR